MVQQNGKVIVRIITNEPPTEVMTLTERQSMESALQQIEPFNLPMAVDQTCDTATADTPLEWELKIKTKIYGIQTYYIRMNRSICRC